MTTEQVNLRSVSLSLALVAMLLAVPNGVLGQSAQSGQAAGEWRRFELSASIQEVKQKHCRGGLRFAGYTVVSRQHEAPVLGSFRGCSPDGIDLADAFSAESPVPVKQLRIPWEMVTMIESDHRPSRQSRKRNGTATAAAGLGVLLGGALLGAGNAPAIAGGGAMIVGAGLTASQRRARMRVTIQDAP
jgi:hypothetical protein